MKKTMPFITFFLSFLYAFLPVCSIILYIFGYTFSLFNYAVFSVALALVSVSATILVLKKQDESTEKSIRILTAVLPLLAIVNWAVYLFKSKEYSKEAIIVTVCMPICFVCAVILTARFCKPLFLKISSIFLPLLPLLALIPLTVFTLFSFGINTVVGTLPSPKDSYYAEIVDSDQGALGGNTVVYVHKNDGIDAFAFSITKTPQRIYMGEWKEYETMDIYWKNEHCLIINSEEYFINQ